MRRTETRLACALAFSWLLVVSSVYVRDVGRGFVKDDFGWIEAAQSALTTLAAPIVETRVGFYRPFVVYTFALDYLAYGANPRGYGFTNLALYVACVFAVWTLCRALGLSTPASALAAMLWGVNPHGINMALVWISGRTALCLTLFALLAAIALVRRRYVWTATFVALALASKEEAMLLPPVLFAWHWIVTSEPKNWRRAVIALVTPLAGYLLLRLHAGAYTPASAPAYYQFSFAPLGVLRNLFEYRPCRHDGPGGDGDRGRGLSIEAVHPARRWHGLVTACAVWFVGGYGLTMFLPVRSSLYALFPSVGAVIACAAVVETMMESAGCTRGRVSRGLSASRSLLWIALNSCSPRSQWTLRRAGTVLGTRAGNAAPVRRRRRARHRHRVAGRERSDVEFFRRVRLVRR